MVEANDGTVVILSNNRNVTFFSPEGKLKANYTASKGIFRSDFQAAKDGTIIGAGHDGTIVLDTNGTLIAEGNGALLGIDTMKDGTIVMPEQHKRYHRQDKYVARFVFKKVQKADKTRS